MKIIIALLTLAFPLPLLAQEASIVDPFDLTSSSTNVEELGIVTKPEVDALESQVKELYNAENCEAAIPLLIEYSRKANWLANMIAANLDPYYGASYDDRKEYPYSKLQPLVPLETLSNEYKEKRNIAIAMQGDCMLSLGDTEGAIPVLLKALDLISLDDEVWWEKTRINLLNIIEVE